MFLCNNVRKAFLSQSQYNRINICVFFPVASLMVTVFCRNLYLIHEVNILLHFD